MGIAHQLRYTHSLSESPCTVSQIVRTLGVSRGSFFRQSILAIKDKRLSVETERIHEEEDDTLGHKKLAPLLGVGKNRVLRIMKKYGIKPRKRNKKYHYPGKSDMIFENLANDPEVQLNAIGIIFSDIFEFKLIDGTRMRGRFALKWVFDSTHTTYAVRFNLKRDCFGI